MDPIFVWDHDSHPVDPCTAPEAVQIRRVLPLLSHSSLDESPWRRRRLTDGRG